MLSALLLLSSAHTHPPGQHQHQQHLRRGGRPSAVAGDCFANPSLCLLNQTCQWNLDCRALDPVLCAGHCVDRGEANQTDCYRFPGTCGPGQWCQLEDHTSWKEFDHGTRGICVNYQRICMACTRTAMDGTAGSMPLAGLSMKDFDGGEDTPVVSSANAKTPSRGTFGHYIERQLVCNPSVGKGLESTCTGDIIPSLPPTCVFKRKPPFKTYPKLSSQKLLGWIQRFLRMGARTFDPDSKQLDRGVDASYQQAQGASRADVQKGVNQMMEVLWPEKALGTPWPGTQTPSNVLDGVPLKCCHWDNYTRNLSPFQQARGKAEYRNPQAPLHSDEGDPPPCIWCEFDGAFNDENPTIWSVIHMLTFNLPETVSESQFAALRALPLWLREHLSCSLCRSHVKEHLIDLGVPENRDGIAWAWYFWRAHNFVNEQSEVTRCGAMNCDWGSFNDPAAAWECPGLYRYPWFMEFEDARQLWTIEPPKARIGELR